MPRTVAVTEAGVTRPRIPLSRFRTVTGRSANVRVVPPGTICTVTVVVQIVPGATTRTFGGLPVVVRNLDNGMRGRVTPASVSATVRGTRSAIRDLSPQLVAAEVDAAGRPPGEYQVDVQVHSAQGVTTDLVTPRMVRLRVTKQ